jgi:hypothetical protein
MISMAEPMTLLEFLRELLTNEQARDLYSENPNAALNQYGLDNLSPADVHDALVLIDDNQTADFDREFTAGHAEAQFTAAPPVPVSYTGGEHQAAVDYINRYIDNTYVRDRESITDNSTEQEIHTRVSNFDQDVDVDSLVASGDGAVAAGEGITGSTVVSGDENQLGTGNLSGDDNLVGTNNDVVGGDGNTVAFGDGAANSASFDDVDVSRGGALAVGGTATGDYDVTGSFNESSATTRNSTEFDGSLNTHNDTATDSFNQFSSETELDSHNTTHTDFQSHNDVAIED